MKQTILRPIISEKSMSLAPDGKYIFEVGHHANKPQIAQEIKKIYKVKVKSINTINVSGKVKKFRSRVSGRTSLVKKAIITLEKGQKIADFDTKK